MAPAWMQRKQNLYARGAYETDIELLISFSYMQQNAGDGPIAAWLVSSDSTLLV